MSQLKELNPEQLQTFVDYIQADRLDQAEMFLIETINLKPTAANNLVQLLHEDADALQMFKENPQILDQQQTDSHTKSKIESNTFEFNFHSSKIKMTDKDGKTTEINDQSPEWDNIKKQLNIDLSQPDALSNLAKNLMDGHLQMNSTESKGFGSKSFDSIFTSNQTTETTQHTTSNHPNMPNSGVEDLTKSKKSNSILLIIGLIIFCGILGLYYFKA